MKQVDDIFDRAFKPKEKLTVSAWCEKNIVLSARVTPWPGRYTSNWCPYVNEPMNRQQDPDTKIVVLCWSSRSSKTETLVNVIRYAIACEPMPWMLVMPNDKLSRTFSRSRFQPSIDDCPILAAEKMEDPDLYSTTEMHLKHCSGWLVGANSPAQLSSKGIGLLVGDELDKWPPQQTRETGALQLALERIKERWNSKAYLSSTPTIGSGQIWSEFIKTDQRYFMVPCLNCGHAQKLKMENLKWSKDAKRSEFNWDAEMVRKTARYCCESCGYGHTDQHKQELLNRGQWVATERDNDPRNKGYHLNSLYPINIAYGDIAMKYLESFQSPEESQNFHNSWLALPIGSSEDRLKFEKDIAQRKSTAITPSSVPKDHIVLMSVDVQRDRLYFIVRAWDRDKNSIRLDYGMIPDFPEAEVVAKRWGVTTCVVDSAYAGRRLEVLEWCYSRPGWIPLLGSPGLRDPLRWVEIELDGGLFKGKKVRTLRIRPNDWKEILHERLALQKPKWAISGDPGADYLKHMSGETRHTRRGPSNSIIIEYIPHGRHDYKDCEIYNMALYEGVRAFVFEMRDEKPLPPSPSPFPVKQEYQEHAEIEDMRQHAAQSVYDGEERDSIW